MNKKILLTAFTSFLALSAMTGCRGNGAEDEYDSNGRLIVSLKNVYFDGWTTGDPYTAILEEKFGLSIDAKAYSYNDWDTQISGELNANNLPDVFHFDLESFNYGNTYEFWAEDGDIKALPDDLSNWPNLKRMIDNTSNIDSLKIDGHLYGIPIAYNIANPSKNFSSFTYVYRRDWAKQFKDSSGNYTVYKENDIYTWEEFNALLDAFQTIPTVHSGDAFAIADVEWGFPSITNFYKDAPHCYTYNSSGKVVNAFTTDNYIEGLKATRQMIQDNHYYEQFEANTGDTHKAFKAGNVGVFYENLSYGNYNTLRKEYKEAHPGISNEALEDATAILKVKGPDGKYALEGSENWFSMTFFNGDISDNKMNKVLDMMDYLISEEGTRFAVYGIEGYDYAINEFNEIELSSLAWPTRDGEYAPKNNGAKFLRNMVTLGHDVLSYDPMTNQTAYSIINDWTIEMETAKTNNELRIFTEPGDIKWLTTPLKNSETSGLISQGNIAATQFCYSKNSMTTVEAYKNVFMIPKWTNTLAEINAKLGK